MKIRRIAALPLILSLMLAASACSVAPHRKTVVLQRPEPSASPTPAPAGKLAFVLEKVSRVSVRSFDQAGYFGPNTQFVFGWLDDDRLAAVGVKPVAPQEGAGPTPDHRKPAMQAGYAYIGAKGLVGQILSVDWRTGKAEEIHTVQDEVITRLGLSHDRKKMWYLSTVESGATKLSVSDASMTHDLLEVQDYTGATPVWSSRDKYLGYLHPVKSRSFLELFDGTSTTTVPYEGPIEGAGDSFAIDDDSGLALCIIKGVILLSMPVVPAGDPKALPRTEDALQKIYYKGRELPGYVSHTVWIGTEWMLFLRGDASGSFLDILDISSGNPPKEYAGVINYALSNDLKYICLARESSGGMSDIYVAEWAGGAIVNEKLVFKGFIPEGGMYFSPDDSKLYMEGRYVYAEAESTAMVLQFK